MAAYRSTMDAKFLLCAVLLATVVCGALRTQTDHLRTTNQPNREQATSVADSSVFSQLQQAGQWVQQQRQQQQQWQQLSTSMHASGNRKPIITTTATSSLGSGRSCKGSRQQQLLLQPMDALAPDGGLPLCIAQSLNPGILFMAALADFAYVKELGSSSRRQDCAPCLQQWGAVGQPVVIDSKDAAGGISHCTVFRTAYDLFLIFRGLDELQSLYYIEMDTAREYAAAYFGVQDTHGAAGDDRNEGPEQHHSAGGASSAASSAKSSGHGKSGSQRSSSSSRGNGNEDFYVLRGFLRAHQAIEPLYMTQLNKLAAELPAQQQSIYRVWIIGHSDGSSLAQLAALRLSYTLGTEKIGGVVLFGTQRVGSPAFADYYNSMLGNQTLRVQYGWDPATEVLFPASAGLKLVGRGYAMCPAAGQALERLEHMPLGKDVPMVCGQPAVANTDAAAGTTVTAVAEEEDGVGGGHITAGLQQLQQAATAAVCAAAGVAAASSSTGQHDLSSRHGTKLPSSSIAGIPGAGELYRSAAVAAGVAAALSSSRDSISSNGNSTSRNGWFDIRFLAHHMPALVYDGLLRALGDEVDNSILAALQLPICAVSTRCAAALRQKPGLRCDTCSNRKTCDAYWRDAAGPKCDDRQPLWSGYLCYNSYFAPGLVGLLGLFGGNQPAADALPTA